MLLLPSRAALQVNRVYHSDALLLCSALEAQSVDMILCDLPYGTTACSWDVIIPFEPMWAAFKRVIKPRGAIVLTASQPFTSTLVCSNLGMFRYEWVWDKGTATGGATADVRPMKAHESILVFSLFPNVYNPQMILRSDQERKRDSRGDYTTSVYAIYGGKTMTTKSRREKLLKHPTSVIRIPALNATASERIGHPTQKPVALFEYLIRTYTQAGDVVLDPTCGSGTTAIAARNTGRNFICGDSSAEYVAVARKRLDMPYTLPMLLETA